MATSKRTALISEYFHYLPVIFFFLLIIIPLIFLWLLSYTSVSHGNILLFSIDTLRADRLGCYGSVEARTPNIDRFSRQSALFPTVITASPETLPAHASLFTGRNVTGHRCLDNRFTLPDSEVTISEMLLEKDFQTRAISNAVMSFYRGFEQGFQVFNGEIQASRTPNESMHRAYFPFAKQDIQLGSTNQVDPLSAVHTTDRAIKACQEFDDRSFFLWVHYWDPHNPYDPPSIYRTMFQCPKGDERDFLTPRELKEIRVNKIELTSREINRLKSLYDGEVAYLDREWGRLMRSVCGQYSRERLYIVFTGDHGESLYEHDYYIGHGLSVKNTVLSIPLLISGPGLVRTIIPGPAHITDIVPTLLDCIGVKRKREHIDGKSLFPVIVQTSNHPGRVLNPRPLFSRAHMIETDSVQNGEWKLIGRGNNQSRFVLNVLEDPAERVSSFFSEEDPRTQSLSRDMDRWKRKMSKIKTTAVFAADDKQMNKMLSELGYVDY